MHQITGKVAGREDEAYGVEEQAAGVEDEDQRLSLLGACQQDKNEQQHK